MDRQAHDYAAAAAMAFAQQQQQQAANIQQQPPFGFHPQHQSFPQQMHGLPFMPQHPSLQQFPFHRHMQQQQQQFHPHPHHPSHPLHLRQPQQPPAAFPPHLPPHHIPSPFLGPFDSSPPPPVAPPSDPELQKRIDKLVEYSAKNGPEFESMIREKQKDNPAYSFLFGAEGHDYYRYKLWLSTRSSGAPFNPSYPPSSLSMMPPNPMMIPSPLNPSPLNVPASGGVAPASLLGTPQLHPQPFPPFYDHQQQQQQHSQHFMGQTRPDYDPLAKSFKGLSGPLPSDVGTELNNVLINLTGTKESIKGAKMWFMQRSPFAPALAEALKERVLTVDDSERQLHIIYLANDILFDSLQRRINPTDLDNEALAFKPVLGTMLARVYHNPHNKEANQSRLQKILQFWASKEVYDRETIFVLESEMMNGLPSSSFSGPAKELSASADPSGNIGLPHQAPAQNLSQWQPDKQKGSDQEQADKQASTITTPSSMPISPFAPSANQQYLSSAVPAGIYPPVTATPFGGSMPISTPLQPVNQPAVPNMLPTSTANVGDKLPPYPLFPPGLIPGMVKKMQIGSGVPYSPMSPLDIPTVIPPSTVPPSDILERVSRFFKEIGEVNPSEGPMKPSESNDNEDEYEMEPPVRKGGACIPPPPNLQVDPETGTFADGSVERKPGSGGSGRLGLGASANPNEVSQYDDVYTSYRKQRSTSYHSSMSARSAAR